MSNEQENGGDVVRSCAISQDLEAYPFLIQQMQQQFGENWGGLELDDAISVLNSAHAEHMESMIMAISAKDEQHIDLIIEIVKVAKSKNLCTVLVTRDLSASALHGLMRSGADDFVPYPLPDGALFASLGQQKIASRTVTESEPQVAPAAILPAPAADVATPQQPTTIAPQPVEPVQKQQSEQKAPVAPINTALESARPTVLSTPKTGVVFPVIGMAGGVGASTFAANLAWELQSVLGDSGRVCLLDFGFQFGSVGTYLDTPRSEITLELYSSMDIADADAFNSALSMYKDTVAILPAPPEAVPLDIIGPDQIDKLIELAKSQFDYVIIDLPNTLMSWSETVLEKSHLMFALLEMDMRSAQNALRFLRALKADDLPYEKVQFILNRAPKMTDLNGRSRVKRMADSLNIEFRWSLPNGGKHVVSACDQGLPMALTAARNPLRKDLRKIAENLIALADDQTKNKIKARA